MKRKYKDLYGHQTEFTDGLIYGIEFAAQLILDRGEDKMFSVNNFSTMIARELQETINDIVRNKLKDAGQ